MTSIEFINDNTYVELKNCKRMEIHANRIVIYISIFIYLARRSVQYENKGFNEINAALHLITL